MAGISRDKNGTRRIQFYAPDGRQKAIYLGKCSQKLAEAIKVRVEAILAAAAANQPLDAETARWVSGLDTPMADKLAAVGLIPKREDMTLGGLLKIFDDRNDVKPATKVVWENPRRNLIEFFGENKNIREITTAQAEDFHQYLISLGLAAWTIHKRLQFCRMFFRTAIRRGLVTTNPFAEVAHKKGSTTERQYFVTREAIARLLAACSLNWQVIIGLSRFGGLRCPSEVLSLRWVDIKWDAGRFIVWSPKTAHHKDKDHRVVPLFPELRAILEKAYEVAKKEGHQYVVNGCYRLTAMGPKGWKNANLRTCFCKLIKRVGLTPWPRLFHNMRASRETELVAQFPIQVVTAWLGNTPTIAMQHYLQVRESDFEAAVKGIAPPAVLPITPSTMSSSDPAVPLTIAVPAAYSGDQEAPAPKPRKSTKKDSVKSSFMAALNAALDTAIHSAPCSPLLSHPLMSYQFGAARPNMGHHALPHLAEGTGLEPATPLLGHHISSVAASHSLTLREQS